ncbi:unnamed protein product [Mytilus edulis]|uniref:EGF-like domain-containing protein n=1 Tax=Mytilus edulis TaxID=6550 RepID=A0A8S3Q881_MYTED|nr:unnamed protein product [Mytilus edulis]
MWKAWTDSLKHTTFAPNKTLDVDCVNKTKQINCRDCSNFQVSKSIMCCNENECEDSTTTNANKIVQTVTESTVIITGKCEKTTCLNGGVCIVFGNNTLCQCSSQYFGNKCQLSGQEGTQFLLVIPEQYDSGMASLRSNVLIATDNSTLIWVYSSTSRRNTSTFIHISHPYYNPESNLITRDGYNTAGIEISSEVPMSMYGFILSDWDDNSEGYLAFPVQYAAKSYIVPSFTVSKFRGFSFISKSLLTISPLESDTKMQINLKLKSGSLVLNNVKYKNNDTIQIVIQKHETFQLSHSSDLTGTMITANKRFLLISGNICNYIKNIAGCNPFIEMVLPINQLDKFYVIPKIATRHIVE